MNPTEQPQEPTTRTGAPRLRMLAGSPVDHAAEFARDVHRGLTASPKRLSCRFFYDEPGSALFEAICRQPEYYIPRAEHEILTAHAAALAARYGPDATIVELGGGNASKTRLLLAAFLARQRQLTYATVDISADFLRATAQSLTSQFEALDVIAFAGEYGEGVPALHDALRARPGRRLVLWLGSNIGNLHRDEAAAFLKSLRGLVRPGDGLLVGIDRRKARAVLEPAYDDAAGVTARFNKNLLARIDRELGGDFDLDAFRHRAVWEEDHGRIAMYLDSQRDQRVRVQAIDLDVAFAAGEPMLTEHSYKYSDDEIARLAAGAGLRIEAHWTDSGRRFSSVLFG